MKLITCYKVVHDAQDISVNADRTLALDKAGLSISLYDLNAIEAAVQIAQAQEGSTVTALSVGSKAMMGDVKIRKDVLSRGADSLTVVADDACDELLPAETAKLLAESAKKVGFDLIVCGEGSGDLYAQQTGLLLGERLGVPAINAVSKITVGDGCIKVERELEDEIEELEIMLPAVVSVSSDINTPKLPSMKAILAAGKKPVTVWAAVEVNGVPASASASLVSIKAPRQTDRLKNIVEGDSDDAVAAFAENLRKIFN